MRPTLPLRRLLPCLIVYSLLALPLTGQDIFFHSSDQIFSYDFATGQRNLIIGTTPALFDIAFHPNGRLYGLLDGASLVEINLTTGQQTEVLTPEPGTFFANALTIAADGTFYLAGGALFTFRLGDAAFDYRGDLPDMASGDLAFFGGELYVSTMSDNILRVNLANLGQSEAVITSDVPGLLTGIVVVPENCEEFVMYAFSGVFEDMTPEPSFIYRVDFENGSLTPVTPQNVTIFGAASPLEFIASAPLSVNGIGVSFPNCDLQGEIRLFVTGGEGQLTYSGFGLPTQTSPVFNDVALGEYLITIEDENGCSVERTVVVDGSISPVLDAVSARFPDCTPGAGEITVTSSGNGPISYSVDGGQTYGPNNVLPVPGPGSYDVRIRDDQGCVRFTRVDLLPDLLPTLVATDYTAGCAATPDALTVSATGGARPLRYSFGGSVFSADSVLRGLPPGTERVYVRDAFGCADSTAVALTVPVPLRADTVLVQPTRCALANGSIRVVAAGGQAPYAYQFGEPELLFSVDSLGELAAGDYDLRIIDDADCVLDLGVVSLPSSPAVGVSTRVIPGGCGGAGSAVSLLLSDTSRIMAVLLPTDTLAGGSELLDVPPGDYPFTVLTSAGCLLPGAFRVAPAPCDFYLPTGFSPNGDGVNDAFTLFGEPGATGVIERLVITDRWGGEVVRLGAVPLSPTTPLWDGTHRGRPAASGLYTYVVEVIQANGFRQSLSGGVQLVR